MFPRRDRRRVLSTRLRMPPGLHQRVPLLFQPLALRLVLAPLAARRLLLRARERAQSRRVRPHARSLELFRPVLELLARHLRGAGAREWPAIRGALGLRAAGARGADPG